MLIIEKLVNLGENKCGGKRLADGVFLFLFWPETTQINKERENTTKTYSMTKKKQDELKMYLPFTQDTNEWKQMVSFKPCI